MAAPMSILRRRPYGLFAAYSEDFFGNKGDYAQPWFCIRQPVS